MPWSVEAASMTKRCDTLTLMMGILDMKDIFCLDLLEGVFEEVVVLVGLS